MGSKIDVKTDFSSPIDVLGAEDILLVRRDVIGDVLGTAINAASLADDRDFNIRGIVTARNSGDAIRLGLSSDPSGSSGGSINIYGTGSLRADAGAAIAAYIQDIEIVTSGTLKGQNGIFGNLLGGAITVKGAIRAEDHAIYSEGEALAVVNRGLLKSTDDVTVFLTGGGNSLLNAGVIRGPEFGPAIRLDSEFGDFNAITITGKVFSDDVALDCGAGNESVSHDGFIAGDIILGDGFNSFSCRKGTVDGFVFGGMDNDSYNIFGNRIKIKEQDGGGIDSVYAARTTTLARFTENLFLLGKKDIDGKGNAEDNGLFGNAGDNILRGFGGADLFSAGRGNDKCFGGGGPDTFMIYSDSGKDRIMDFAPDEDILDVTSFGYDSRHEALDHFIRIKGGVAFTDGGCRIELPDFKFSLLDGSNIDY